MRKLISLVTAILVVAALPRPAYAHHLGLSIEHDVLMLVVYGGFMLIILGGWLLLGLDPLPRSRPRLGAILSTAGLVTAVAAAAGLISFVAPGG